MKNKEGGGGREGGLGGFVIPAEPFLLLSLRANKRQNVAMDMCASVFEPSRLDWHPPPTFLPPPIPPHHSSHAADLPTPFARAQPTSPKAAAAPPLPPPPRGSRHLRRAAAVTCAAPPLPQMTQRRRDDARAHAVTARHGWGMW